MAEPIYDQDAEMSALGGAILSDKACREVALVPNEAFFRPAHRHIHDAVCKAAATGVTPDLLVMKHLLTQSGKLSECGGMDYLFQMAENVPSAANSSYYCHIVKELWSLRQIRERAAKIVKECDDRTALEHVIASAQALSVGVSPETNYVFSLADVLDDAGMTGHMAGVPTPFDSVNRLNDARGWPCGQLSVVSAFRKAGKTSFMSQCAMRNALDGKSVVYVTVADLSRVQLARKIMRQRTGCPCMPTPRYCEAAGIPWYDGFDQHWREARDELVYTDFWVYDSAKMKDGRYVETIIGWLSSWMENHVVDAVYVDYGQRLRSRDKKAVDATREGEACCGALMDFAGKHERTAVVVGSQITKTEMGVGTKYSKAWEEDGGFVLRLEGERGGVEHDVECKVYLNRFGGAGETILRWHPGTSAFSEKS